jgi:hypothetical protein
MFMFVLFDEFIIVTVDVVRQRGLEHITVDDLVTEITPKGRGMSNSFDLCFFSYLGKCTL